MGALEDRIAIIDVCTRMAWHADRRDWKLLAEVFTDEVVLDYTSLNGGEPATLTREQLVAGWSGLLGSFDATQHLITNHLVTVTGPAAVVLASFQATHRLGNPFGSPLWTLGGTYRFDLVRAEGEWRIGGVVMTAQWAEGNKDLLTLAAS
jgi:hypothetical protein